MGYSYATLFVLVCAAIMAATPPSTAQPLGNLTIRIDGELDLEPIGATPVANATVELMCLTPSGGLGVAGAVTTQPGGRISGSAVLDPLQLLTNIISQTLLSQQRILMMSCMFVAQAEASAGSPPGPSTLMMAPITASRRSGNPTTYDITPRGPLKPPPKLYA